MKQQIYHSIEIGLHSKCNLHCPLCTRSKKFFLDNKDHRKFNNELDFEDLKNAILTIKPQELKLVGAICEPTMYYKFIELLEFCKEQNISAIFYNKICKRRLRTWAEPVFRYY